MHFACKRHAIIVARQKTCKECAAIQFWLNFSKFMWAMQVAEEDCVQTHMAAGVWERDLQQTSVGFNTIGVASIQGRPCV